MAQVNTTPSEVRSRVDLATILGVCISLGCILGGLVVEGGKVADVAQATAALIVFGGTIGAVLVTTPIHTFMAALRRAPEIWQSRSQPFHSTIENLLGYSERARKSGIASLEWDAAQTTDEFLRKGLDLAADGSDVQQIRDIMLLELEQRDARSESEVRVWESAAGYAPTVGIMGAVLGLIQVMKHLDNVDEVGRGIAVAFVATVYGVASANLLFLPAAGKLRARSHALGQLREMMLEGIVAIAEGMNPTLIRIKLGAFAKPQPVDAGRRVKQPAAVSLLIDPMPEAQS